jgi:SAM-dependent methyltransferase
MSKEEHYRHHSPAYGMGHTRRDRILSLANGTGLRILDVGCGNGALGLLLKQRGNWVGGVELSAQAVSTARERLDAVWSFDIEGPWLHEVVNKAFDIIVLAEVLEHVFDPIRVLQSVHTALKPDGAVIITTPNFLTWTNRSKFLFGNFRYQEQGMFDFGHIRWFTYQYLSEVLTASGFTVTDERHIIFPGKLTRFLKQWPSLFAWQFVLKATLSSDA